ncbi:SixA phosphatase family protein [Pedobacter metabolipauper]|uniref:Phosphohistidine phosphatase n=1 Tax=Pedobacter metabolipauper TaxID=425513 RepID=A0A4R6STL2_9SPHI|nr:histidine phosphatase family protein [Pedobacter metabolipauper]TDQ08348.1 phosphohistidine phosphatase [Pedobacter metabolipauper]
MKQLLLVRHGKSDWGNSHLSDFDRPLNARGHRDAPEMARRIFQKDLVPQIIVSSPALRALTTAIHFLEAWQKDADLIVQAPDIYEAEKMDLLGVVNGLNDRYDRIALFGHNPGLTDFANYLGNANIYNIPTCGVVLIEFQADSWSEISQSTGTVVDIDYPKNSDGD